MAPVRFGCGLGMERFERFQFSVPAVPLKGGGFSVFQHNFTERPVRVSVHGKRFRRFRFRVRFLRKVRNGPNTVSRSTVSNTELSEFFGAH